MSIQVTGAMSEQENDPKITVIHSKNLKNMLELPWNNRLELKAGDLMSSCL